MIILLWKALTTVGGICSIPSSLICSSKTSFVSGWVNILTWENRPIPPDTPRIRNRRTAISIVKETNEGTSNFFSLIYLNTYIPVAKTKRGTYKRGAGYVKNDAIHNKTLPDKNKMFLFLKKWINKAKPNIAKNNATIVSALVRESTMLHGATALKKAANKLIKVFLEIVKLRKYIARISLFAF